MACTIKPYSFSTGITPEKFQGSEVTNLSANWCDFLQIASNIIGFLYTLIIPLAVLMVVWGGFNLMIASGDEARIKRGKTIIKSAIIGVVISLGAGILIGTILKTVGVDTSIIPWL
jgi:hypothetical protein